MAVSQKNKERILSFLLSGTILASGCGGAYGGTYEGRDESTLKKLFDSCAQVNYSIDQVPEGAMKLWQYMQTLKDSKTIVGPPLADAAAKADIFYCGDSTPASPFGGLIGLWTSKDGVVRVAANSRVSPEYLFMTQAHETIHGVQTAAGILDEDYSWSLADLQASVMSYEAAATAGEHILALEMHVAGKPGQWKQEDNPQFDLNLEIYKDAMRRGVPPAEALATIGALEFSAWFANQEQLDGYNNRILKRYVQLMVEGRLKPPSGSAYGLEDARKTGYISPAFNYTAKVDYIPSYEARIGSNKRMREGFAYVECERLARTLGRNAPAYLEMLGRLEKEKNPYLGLDLKEVYESKSSGSFLRKMHDFSKRKNSEKAKNPKPS